MNHKITFIATTVLLMSGSAFAQTTTTCPPGTLSCNIATVGDEQISADQTIGDTVNPTYAPDSSHSTSSAANTNDIVSQGGAADATANGNTSTNSNQSSANNNAKNNMTNGSITNDVTSGNATTTSGPAVTQGGNIVQRGSADLIGGTATTNSGAINTGANAVTGASTSSATGGAGGNSVSKSAATGGSVDRSGNSSSRSAVNGSGNSANENTNVNRTGDQSTNVDARNQSSYTYKEAARTAAPVMMPGYGPQNCYGDTNPSGSFGASIQTFGWGVTANSQKASNVCALTSVGAALERGGAGGALAAGYLSQMDPNAYRALSSTINPATGDYYIISSQERARRAKVMEQAKRPAAARKTALACPDGFQLATRDDGSYTCRKGGAVRVQGGAISTTIEHSPPPGTVCPASHPVFVPGKGCRK